MLLMNCSLALISEVSAVDEEWRLRRDRDSIQACSRKIEAYAHAAVKTVTVMEGVSLASLVALTEEDVEACPAWADKCAQSYVHERVSETEACIHIRNSMPFPVKDRDLLAHVKWSQNPANLEVVMESVAMSGMLDKVRGRLRLTGANAGWKFLPLDSNTVQITNEAHINPDSNLPGWVTKLLLVDTPFETRKAFVAEVARPKYQNASLSFIRKF